MNSIASKIREAIDQKDMPYRLIAERAERAGHTLSFSTVSTYASGKARKYSREKLVAIAVGLGLPEDTFTEAANMPTLGDPFELKPEAALLEPHERDAVRRVVDAFIQNKTGKVVGNDADSTAPMSDAGETPATDGGGNVVPLRGTEKAQGDDMPTEEEFLKMASYKLRPGEDESRRRDQEWSELGEESQDPDQ